VWLAAFSALGELPEPTEEQLEAIAAAEEADEMPPPFTGPVAGALRAPSTST